MDQHRSRAGQDRAIEPDAPPLDIFEIRFEAPRELLRIAGRTAMAADLREAGDPRLDGVTFAFANRLFVFD